MHKQLIAHRAYVTQQLETSLEPQQRQELFAYHTERVHDFQHERLIHLLVTFFFGLMFLGIFIAWLIMPLPELFWPLTLLMLLLFVLELAYIRHYYQLENGVHSLYALTEKLGKLK